MTCVRAFFMCLGMFTAVPCPYRPWDEDARPLMLVMLPVVGLAIGLLWILLGWLGMVALPGVSRALVAVLPWLLTGFIHLDGYLDTCDALLSWGSREKKLEILKDSHAGAFAVACMAVLAILSYDAAGLRDLRPLLFVPVVSRCGSALCVLTLKPIGHSEYASMQGRTGQRLAVLAMGLIALVACALWLGGRAWALVVETAAYAAAMAWGYRALGGVSGDVAGFALTAAECAALVALSGF